MVLRIQKRFIAVVAAVAISVTGITAAPARAGNDDAGKALAALLGLAIVGAIIADQRNDRKDTKKTVIKPVHPPLISRPLPKRVNRKLLPQDCLRSFHTDRGKARIFGQRCLQRNYQYVNSLPHDCHRSVYTDRGWRQGYGARCLNRYGYQLARH